MHFLHIDDFDKKTVLHMLECAAEVKVVLKSEGRNYQLLQ
jgi:hypothetical protein